MLSRRIFQQGTLSVLGSLVACQREQDEMSHIQTQSSDRKGAPHRERMPVLFAGHGSPMNAIEDNRWRRGFASLTEGLPRPKAILAISAHWFVDGVWLTGEEQPRTIHDFYGFPRALHEVDYPARGSVDLAKQVRAQLEERGAGLSTDWGLDHGTWSVLMHMYPQADVPVVQLSIDRRLDPRRHFEIGRSLAPLRDEGVLIFTSGNIVHNLRDAIGRAQTGDHQTPEWASAFDRETTQRLGERDMDGLIGAWPAGGNAQLAHPSPDHWLPLLYAAGASTQDDSLSFPVEGFDLGSVSMRSVRFG